MSESWRQRLTKIAIFWLLLYPSACVMGCLFMCLRMLGSVQVLHRERIPKRRGVVVVSNHPSLWEPILLPFLFFPRFILFPDRRIPFCVVDQHNYSDNWLWGVLRTRFIAVPRQDRSGKIKALIQMTRMVAEGYTLILFPEGGRTFKGTDYFRSPVYGKQLRTLMPGIAEIVIRNTTTQVLPMWVDGSDRTLPNNGAWLPRFWRKTTITIGYPIDFIPSDDNVIDKQAIIDRIASELLVLADEAVGGRHVILE